MVKRLLMVGALLLLAHGLKGAAEEIGEFDISNATASLIPAGQSEPSEYPSRLSSLILPLPPLVLPDLLLPPYNFPSFESERLDQELQLYLQYLRTHGKPDILIMGSSRSLQGIDPAALETALAEQGYANLKVYNFGINGATAQVMNLLVQEILTPEQLPRLIIWGDGSRAFNSGRPDRTYQQIVTSPGYQRLASGDRPIPARTTDWEIPTFVTTANKELANSAVAAVAETAIETDLTPQGFQVVTDEYDPVRYFQQFPRVPGDYDADYDNFSLLGEQISATVNLANFAKQHGITLVFVNLPLTDDYLDAIRRSYESQFQRHMWQIANQQGFLFRDLSRVPDLIKNNYFADPSHINQHGARAVAFHLAQDQTLPWWVVANRTSPTER
ncbi:MAG: hypothetical protein MUF72_07020 [Elainella sp. Prado103]|nr:hypothetical protein [Elainella sp. Prado103]